MRSSIIMFIVLIITALLKEQILTDAVIFRWTNAMCGTDNKSFVLHSCRLKAVQRYRTVLNFNGTLIEPVYDMRARVQVLKRANGYKPWLFDISFDVCQFLIKNNNPFVKMLYNVFRDFSNINHTCPFVGPVIIKDLYLKADNVPLPLPTGEYAVLIDWTFNHRPKAVYTNYYFEFIEDL